MDRMPKYMRERCVKYRDTPDLFWKKSAKVIGSPPSFIKIEMERAIKVKDRELMGILLHFSLTLPSSMKVRALNRLLTMEGHDFYYMVFQELLALPDTATVRHIDGVLSYSFSRVSLGNINNTEVVEWFSALLMSVGTLEAYEVMQRHSESENTIIAEEMKSKLPHFTMKIDSQISTSPQTP